MTSKNKGSVKAAPVKNQTDGKASSVRRNDAQFARELVNRENYPALTPWETSRKKRHDKRIARGLTYDNWRKNNSARSKDEEPNVSNTATRSSKRSNGNRVSKSGGGNRRSVSVTQKV